MKQKCCTLRKDFKFDWWCGEVVLRKLHSWKFEFDAWRSWRESVAMGEETMNVDRRRETACFFCYGVTVYVKGESEKKCNESLSV